ncbi:Mlr7408 protein [hydrothermal vent metagenome]|uniref:Mlr7408 protein n=1 Tax=hydrothermal vent metagenome TaxID=652676 RepID=A0A3B0U116_9ZZZZ
MAKRILSEQAGTSPNGVPNARVTKRRSSTVFSKIFGTGVFAVLGFAFSISPVSNPQLFANHRSVPVIQEASLSYQGQAPIITGSVNQLFETPSFIGPTSNQKRNRLRPQTNILEFADSFSAQRVQIAALRVQPVEPVSPAHPIGGRVIDTATRISLASIDPALASAALKAIEQATPLDPSIPVPIVSSAQLAYVRAEAPTTERAVNRFSEREQWCLSTAIYFEARGESYRGQVGVAQVVMNRVKSRTFPNSICGVVFQNKSWRNRCQFSFACDGIPDRVREPAAWAKAEEITQKVTSGEIYLPEVADAINYHANYVYPAWAPRMKRLTQIGTHIFYRFRS